MKLVLDTNALLWPARAGIDLQQEAEAVLGRVVLIVPSAVVDELQHLAAGGGKDARGARTALAIADRFTMESTELPGDDGVLDVARRLQAGIATDDRRLAGEARASGLMVVQSRGTQLWVPRGT